MFTNPVSDLYMIGMGVFSETGSLRLLRREEALLPFSDLEKAPLGVPVVASHIAILQLNRTYAQPASRYPIEHREPDPAAKKQPFATSSWH